MRILAFRYYPNNHEYDMSGTPIDLVDARTKLQGQYERYPYPTPEKSLTAYISGQRMELGFPRFFYSKYWPYRPYIENLDILVAGCGSSQAARYAASHPGAHVTGIDISSASLEACSKLIAQHGLNNVQLKKLALEDIATLDQQFDLIVCTGVIHHLPDPALALRALRGVLKPEGSLYLMVYARHGRDAIYYLQDLCRLLGLTAESATAEDVEHLRRFIETLPLTHPYWQRKKNFPDMLGTSELVDYLLNVRDRAYTLGEFSNLLDQGGLRIQSFMQRAHYSPYCCGLKDSPFFEVIRQREQLVQYEIGELYRACLFKHELIACSVDRPAESYNIDLEQMDWEHVIPEQAPGLCFNPEQPLAGTVGWLSWRGHHFADIRLPLTSNEKYLLDAINGKATLAHLSSHISQDKSMSPGNIKEFVVRLLEFDFAWLRGLPRLPVQM